MILILVLYVQTMVLALSLGLLVGLHISSLQRAVTALKQAIGHLQVQKQIEPQQSVQPPDTFIVDANDPVQRAKWQRDQIRKGLNPEGDDEA